MGLYKNIKVDFIKRTKENLDYIMNNSIVLPQEITHFINMCYGLLIFPVQNIDNIISQMPQDISHYGVNDSDITISSDKSFRKVIKSMRNGFAHGHLQSLSLKEGTEFDAIAIEDIKKNGSTPHIRIELSLEQLQRFILTFTEEYLKVLGTVSK